MRWKWAIIVAVASWAAPSILMAQGAFVAPEVAVGNKLETATSIVLGAAAPADGLDIVLRSKEPAKLLLSKAPDQAGSATLTLHVRPGVRETPEFWVQAMSNTGTAIYSIEAPGYTTAHGSVLLKPSAIVLIGPLKAPRFTTTISGAPIPIALMAARLDDSGNFAEEQAVAGGLNIEAELANSAPATGAIVEKPAALKGGTSTQAARFQPAHEGETTLSVVTASGFSVPTQFATLIMAVRKPGLAVSDQMYIGQNLQIAGVLSLGEAAPAKGVTVTLTSEDPKRLLLSPNASEPGKGSISLRVAAGGASAQYYLQALGNSGTITYTASAEGFQSRTGTLGLAPSGILLTPFFQGPPDEAHVLRKEAPDGVHRFSASLEKPVPISLIAWTAQLDPVTHRGADITVQPLRAGMSLKVLVSNNNSNIVDIAQSVEIKGGFDHGAIDLKPLAAGTAEIDIGTPSGFIQPANSTKVIISVEK